MNFIYSSLLSIIYISADAQNFLNGSFETNSAYSCDYNLTNAVLTGEMANTVGYGTGNEIDVMSSCFPYCTSAPNGTWYISLANSTGGAADAMTMQLSVPLVAGATYTMEFWDHGDSSVTYEPSPIQIGISTTSNATGTVVYIGPTPQYGVWKKRTFTFVAPNNGQYISVSATSTRWSQVDDFALVGLLPIQLVSFTGEEMDGKVKLQWTTQSELNNDYFTIERSADGISFTPLIIEKGAGTSTQVLNYFTYDAHPLWGKNFYRLSQTDYNGVTVKFHVIEVVMGNLSVTNPVFFPNPTTGIIHIENMDPSLAYSITVSNLLGQEVETFHEIPDAELDLRSLRRGVYFVRFEQQNQNWCDYVVKE